MPKLIILKSPKISMVVEDEPGKTGDEFGSSSVAPEKDWIDGILACETGRIWGIFVMKENGNHVRIPLDNIGAIQDVTDKDLKEAKEKAKKDQEKAAAAIIGGGRKLINPAFIPPGRGGGRRS